jgi:hypothetical protein
LVRLRLKRFVLSFPVSIILVFFAKSTYLISGDANNVQVGSGTNIQDNSVVHVAKSNLSGKVFPTIIGDNVTVGKYRYTFCFLF